MRSESAPYESYFDSGSLMGMYRSGWKLVQARRIRPRGEVGTPRFRLGDFGAFLLYTLVIIVPGFFLNLYQNLHHRLTGKPRAHPEGSWQFYLYSGLREDVAHHTNETSAYHRDHPAEDTELDVAARKALTAAREAATRTPIFCKGQIGHTLSRSEQGTCTYK